MSATQPRETPNDDYEDCPGHLQACLSVAWRRRQRAAGPAPPAWPQTAGTVLCQAAADPDRAGGVRRLASLGAVVVRLGARGGAVAAAIREGLRQARQERRDRRGGDLRSHDPPPHALSAHQPLPHPPAPPPI